MSTYVDISCACWLHRRLAAEGLFVDQVADGEDGLCSHCRECEHKAGAP